MTAEERIWHRAQDVERRYTPGGRVAHLVTHTDWGYPYPHALCGWWGQVTYWRGTGSQEEYDRAAELPTCQRCQQYIDYVNLDGAFNVAFRAHQGQVDKAGRNYLTAHVADVARRVPVGQEEKAVAWLHDVLEDSDVTEAELRDQFPARVVDAVVAITRRPDESYWDYLLRLREDPLALIVKLADIASNTDPRRMALLDEATRARLTAKYDRALAVLRERRTQ